MNKSKSLCNFLVVLSVVMTAAVFSGCLKASSNSTSNSTNVSFITLMNMAPYSSSMEVYFNGDKKTPVISPGSYSTSYGQIGRAHV